MKQKSRTENSALNLITSVGGQLLKTVLSFVTRTVFIATLGKMYLGIGGLFSNILTMLSLTELGLDMAINFKLYAPLAENDEHRVRILMKFYKQAYRVIGLVIMGLGLCVIPALRYLIKDYNSLEALQINASLVFVLYLMQSVSSYLFFAYKAAIVKAAQKSYILELVEYAIVIVTNVVQIVILYTTQSFIAYTAVLIAFSILQNGVNALIAQKMFPQFLKAEKDSISKEELWEMLKDCGALFVYKMNGVVVSATDSLVLSSFIGLAIVGMYSNYLMLYNAIYLFLCKFYASVKAAMGNIFATQDISRSYFIFEVMNFLTILFFGTACIGVAVMADEAIDTWIGASYLIAQPFSILMGIKILFVGLKYNLGQVRNITGAFRQMWFRPVLGMIINLVVSVALVQSWGIYGVIVGTIVADVTTNFMVDPLIIHKYSFKGYRHVSVYYKRNIIYIAILMLVGVADMLLCRIILPGRGWLSVFTHFLICGCSVPAVFLLLYRKTEVCQYLFDKGRSIIAKAVGR